MTCWLLTTVRDGKETARLTMHQTALTLVPGALHWLVVFTDSDEARAYPQTCDQCAEGRRPGTRALTVKRKAKR